MFCTNCGKELPDSNTFCTECGAKLERPQQPTPIQPVQAVSATPVESRPLPDTPVGKNAYFLKYASKQTKLKALIAWGLTAACLLLMIIGCIVTLNTSVENIPIMSMFMQDDDVDEAKEIMSDAMDELEDQYESNEDEIKDTLSKKEIKLIDELIDALDEFSISFSINNTKRVVAAVDALVEKGVDEYFDLEDFEELDVIAAALNVASTVLWVMAMFGVAFTVGGGASRLTPLVSIGMVFTTLHCLIYCGVLFIVLNLAAHICLIVFMTQLNREYRTYRRSYKTA